MNVSTITLFQSQSTSEFGRMQTIWSNHLFRALSIQPGRKTKQSLLIHGNIFRKLTNIAGIDLLQVNSTLPKTAPRPKKSFSEMVNQLGIATYMQVKFLN